MFSRSIVFCLTLAAASLAACSKTAPEAEPAAAAEAPAAPAPASDKQGNAYAFKIGELDAIALRDGALEPPNDNKVFGVGKTPEDVAAVLAANGLATDKLSLSIQPLLVKDGPRVLLFDTGAGTNWGVGGKITLSLAEAGLEPAAVTDIFISHSHGDHIGGLVDGEGKLAFPNATVHISRPEWDHLSSQKDLQAVVKAVTPQVDAFQPGAELVPGVVRAVEVKGHTPGHSAYRISSGADTLLYIGDAMHHYVVSVQKPEWTISFDGDASTATASRQALVASLADSGERVYAVHFPYPGLGKFEKRPEGAVWVAE